MSNSFQQLRINREKQEVKSVPPVSPFKPWNTDNSNYYQESLDSFLAQRRSRTPSFINYDKIAQCMNYAGAVYLPISFAAMQLSRSKMLIYQHNDDSEDGKSKVPFSARSLYGLFTTHPNPNDTFNQILYSMSQQHDLCGECYVWMPPIDTRDGWIDPDGVPQEFYVIPSAWISGLPSCPWWEGGAYAVTPYVSQYPGSTQSAFIPSNQMLRVYDPNPLFDKTAYSVMAAISQAIDTVRAIDQSRESTQAQGTQQNLALEIDPQIVQLGNFDVKRAREIFQEINAGSRNAGKALFLPPGVKANKISTQPDDMAWTEGWTQLTDFAFATFHTNRAALGMSGDLNYATLYASIKQLYWSKLQPRTEAYGMRWTKDYFIEYVGEDYFGELDLPAMNDEQITYGGLDRALKARAVTVGEFRHKLGYPVDAVKMPWVNDRVESTTERMSENIAPDAKDGPPSDERVDPQIEASRPRNVAGRGSLGGRVKDFGSRINGETVYTALDKAMTRGAIKPLNGKH